jgi:hypothetical protein
LAIFDSLRSGIGQDQSDEVPDQVELSASSNDQR